MSAEFFRPEAKTGGIRPHWPDASRVLDCDEQCPNDPEKTEPGDCGCGVPDTDDDGNGIPDCLEGGCAADLSGPDGEPEGLVGIEDLLRIIDQWGAAGTNDETPGWSRASR